MSNKKILLEDQEKTVYEFYPDSGVPDWTFLSGHPEGWGCLTRLDDQGQRQTTDLFHGVYNGQEVKVYGVVPKQKIRPYEMYGLFFANESFDEFTCYAEDQWNIRLQEVLSRFPDLYMIPELAETARKYGVPGLMMASKEVPGWFERIKASVIARMLARLQDPQLIGSLQRESLYHWRVGVENHYESDRRMWVAVSLYWKKIKENLPKFVEDLVNSQHAEMFSYSGDRATVILNKVIRPLVEQHRINLVATKTQMSTQMLVLEHWTAERLTKIMTSCFMDEINEKHS